MTIKYLNMVELVKYYKKIRYEHFEWTWHICKRKREGQENPKWLEIADAMWERLLAVEKEIRDRFNIKTAI